MSKAGSALTGPAFVMERGYYGDQPNEGFMPQATHQINRQLSGMIQARLEFAGISTWQVLDLMARSGMTASSAATQLLERAAKAEERAS